MVPSSTASSHLVTSKEFIQIGLKLTFNKSCVLSLPPEQKAALEDEGGVAHEVFKMVSNRLLNLVVVQMID